MAAATAGNRRVFRRLYFVEIFVLLNLAAIVLLTIRFRPVVLITLPDTLRMLVPALAGYALAGVVIRAVVARVQGGAGQYLRVIRSGGWILDTVRIAVAVAVLSHTYFWIKLLVPILHRRDFDQSLWNLDQTMFFGLAPSPSVRTRTQPTWSDGVPPSISLPATPGCQPILMSRSPIVISRPVAADARRSMKRWPASD